MLGSIEKLFRYFNEKKNIINLGKVILKKISQLKFDLKNCAEDILS